MVNFKDFSWPLSVFQILFKANFIFKDLDSPVYSSTFQACANPEDVLQCHILGLQCFMGTIKGFPVYKDLITKAQMDSVKRQ